MAKSVKEKRDIVERLKTDPYVRDLKVCEEAAKEIEKLRRQLAKLEKCLDENELWYQKELKKHGINWEDE